MEERNRITATDFTMEDGRPRDFLKEIKAEPESETVNTNTEPVQVTTLTLDLDEGRTIFINKD